MPLTLGSRVGTCEIIGSLGEGGMGVVYRARDLRLSRDVAIKLVSEKIADDPQHRARLDREAQALAALNHPNIAQIYGVADTSDGPALLMELVEGPTLAEVIKAGAVTTTMFAQIATQLLAALEYAHGAGVIHRDLKPANIKLRADSVIKVLDFGLAKRQSPSSVDASAASSPTTITDSTYGTPEYMAPELLRGAPAARSSDIFAIGVLLFELATRQRPFHRGSVFQTAEAILNDAEPGWPAGSPFSDSVQQVISRAMAKDAIVRYGSVAELRTALADALSPSPIVPRKPTPTSRKQVRAIAVALAVAVALLGVGVLGPWFRQNQTQPPSTPPSTTETQLTFLGDVRGVALAPDGRTAAYATRNGGLFVRDLVGGQAIEIWRGELVVEFQWTREGSDILLSGIQDDRLGLWLVPRLGGPGRRLNARGAHIALSPDGRSFARAMQNSQGFTVSPIDGNGDTRIQMTGFQWLLGLDWGLTSKRLAVLTQDEDGSRSVWTIAPDGADRRLLYTAKNLASLRWSPLTNELYVIRGRNELADVVRLKDEARSSDEQVVVSGLPWDDSDPYQQSVSLSTDGRKFLVIRSFTYANLWRISGKNGSPSPITTGTSRYNRPRVSPDGQWIAATLGVGAKSMVVKIATTGGPAIPLTPPNRRATSPAWSPDGSRIAFAAQRDGVPRIWIAQADGTEAFEVANSVTDTDDGDISWFSGDRIIWQLPGSENYTVRDLRSNEQEMLLENSAAPNGWLTNLRVSPTGGEIAFWRNSPHDEANDGIWIVSWPSKKVRQLSRGTDYPAGWSETGGALFGWAYLGRDVRRFSLSTNAVESVGQFPIGALDGCDVSQRDNAVICAVRESKSDAWVIENLKPSDR